MANLMVLGPDRARTSDLRSLLRQDGHDVCCFDGIPGWRDCEREARPEVVIATVDSFSDVLTEEVGHPTGRGRFPAPLLFVQGEGGAEEIPFLDDRLVDRVTSPFLHDELLGHVDALVRVHRVVSSLPAEADAGTASARPADGVSGVVRRAGKRVAAVLRTRLPRYEKPLDPYLEVAKRAARWADCRDAYEPGHAERVTSFCAMIAEGLDLAAHETSALLRAAMLHDIGKVALPVEVLHQKTPLEESQMQMIRTHPRRGAALIRALDRDDDVAEAIHCHHERPDGFGYYGLDLERIPLSARILAVSEVFDGMTTTRLKDPLTAVAAMARLETFRGVSLDADCVDALVDRLKPTPVSV